MQITNEDKYSEAKRELGARIPVYSRLVQAGHLTEELATRRIAVMRSIVDDYLKLCAPGLDLEAPCNLPASLAERPAAVLYFVNSMDRDELIRLVSACMPAVRAVRL